MACASAATLIRTQTNKHLAPATLRLLRLHVDATLHTGFWLLSVRLHIDTCYWVPVLLHCLQVASRAQMTSISRSPLSKCTTTRSCRCGAGLGVVAVPWQLPCCVYWTHFCSLMLL
jgi:hypothetical protein